MASGSSTVPAGWASGFRGVHIHPPDQAVVPPYRFFLCHNHFQAEKRCGHRRRKAARPRAYDQQIAIDLRGAGPVSPGIAIALRTRAAGWATPATTSQPARPARNCISADHRPQSLRIPHRSFEAEIPGSWPVQIIAQMPPIAFERQECGVRRRDRQCELYVDTGRPECANSGHCSVPTGLRRPEAAIRLLARAWLPSVRLLSIGRRAAHAFPVLFRMLREGAPCPKSARLLRPKSTSFPSAL